MNAHRAQPYIPTPLTDSFNDAAGINVVGQNAGANSQIQQNVSVQANLEAL